MVQSSNEGIAKGKKRKKFKNGKTEKWRNMKNNFQRKKRSTVRIFYKNFTENLKDTNPRKFFSMAKQIGSQTSETQIMIPELDGLSDILAAENIAEYFSDISNQYDKINRGKFPCFLPSMPPPQVTEFHVLKKIEVK